MIAELLSRSYLIRDAHTGDVIGVFLLNDDGTRLAGTDGIDLPLTIRIAKAAVHASRNTSATHPPETDYPNSTAACDEGSDSAPEIRDTWPPGFS